MVNNKIKKYFFALPLDPLFSKEGKTERITNEYRYVHIVCDSYYITSILKYRSCNSLYSTESSFYRGACTHSYEEFEETYE